MIEQLLNGLMIFLGEYGVVGIFVLVTLEYLGLPISSEIILPFMGVLMYCGLFSYLDIIFWSILGGLVGSTIAYCIGYYGREKIWSISNKKYIGIKGVITELDKWFSRYGGFAAAICRVLPMTRNFISFVAGIQKVKFSVYLTYSFLGITIWNTTLVLMGYFLSENINSIEGALRKCYVIAYSSLFISIIYFIYRKRKIRLI